MSQKRISSISLKSIDPQQWEEDQQDNIYLPDHLKKMSHVGARPISFNAYEDFSTKQQAAGKVKRKIQKEKQLIKSKSLLSPTGCSKVDSFFNEYRVGRLNTSLLDAIEHHHNAEVKSLLQIGANPNATCRLSHISACHVASYSNPDALYLLLQYDLDRNRKDKLGRTPLHVAACAGMTRTIAMLLDLPAEIQQELTLKFYPQTEEQIKSLRPRNRAMINTPCREDLISALQMTWKDSIEHKCRKFMSCIPMFCLGWTPLHIASYAAHCDSTRLLLASGADVNCKDSYGRTPLDIAGAVCFIDNIEVDREQAVKTIEALIKYGGVLNTVEDTSPIQFHSALHTAVELRSVNAIELLLAAGAPVSHLDESGNTPLHCCVFKLFKEGLQVLATHTRSGQVQPSVDVPDISGYTVLQVAIRASWVPGVCVALDAGADVTFEALDGNTAIHLAAQIGNLDILDEILNVAHKKNAVNKENWYGETPLSFAILSGSLECVQRIIDAGATRQVIRYSEPSNDTAVIKMSANEFNEINMILHTAVIGGNVDILEFLLDCDKSLEQLLDCELECALNTTPLQYAALRNQLDCFKFLLHKTVERSRVLQQKYDPSILLDIIALANRVDMFKELIELIPDAVHIATAKGHSPMHNAIFNNGKDVIVQLINHGADLSQTNEHGYTAMSFFFRDLSKPTDLIASIFDYYIYTNDIPVDSLRCVITVDYRVLSPSNNDDVGQMMVLKALLKTGNRKGQKKLLAHPLVESFLYLKWKSLTKFFFMIIFLYALFVMSVSIYVVTVFYYKDANTNNSTNSSSISDPIIVPIWLDPYIWRYLVYITLGLVLLQELSCSNLTTQNWYDEVLLIETWVKILSYVLAMSIPFIITMDSADEEWRRHLASLTLVLVWLNIMQLLLRTPSWGYYMQMFTTVSTKVIKILLTFSFLIIVSSFCFMIELHSKPPFQGPWESFVKTLVMMTSEFDYENMFEMAESISTSLIMLRIVFLVFLILTAIVLMNLMIGVAVHDLHNLVQDGTLRRLEKQVEFLYRLEVAGGKKSLHHRLGLFKWYHRKKVPQIIKIKAVDENCLYSGHIRDVILNKAQERLEKMKKKEELNKSEAKMADIFEAITAREDNIMRRLDQLEAIVQQNQRRHD